MARFYALGVHLLASFSGKPNTVLESQAHGGVWPTPCTCLFHCLCKSRITGTLHNAQPFSCTLLPLMIQEFHSEKQAAIREETTWRLIDFYTISMFLLSTIHYDLSWTLHIFWSWEIGRLNKWLCDLLVAFKSVAFKRDKHFLHRI